MEEEAEYANREGYSKHHPALPLFTSREANLALSLFRPVEFRDEFKLSDHVSFELHPAGHILGSSFCLFHHRKKSLTIGFSGDLGRPNDALMKPPAELPPVHYLVLESTYGDRLHPAVDPTTELQSVVETIIEQNSVLIIPAFAVGRTQEILYYLARLREQGRLDGIGVYLDSPMASQVSELYWRYHDQHKLSRDQCEMISSSVTIVRNAEQSMALLRKPSPKIIISASGMATGGRVLHHLRNYLGNPNNVILFTGFQAEGTRGRQLVDGQDKVKIHGRQISVAAQIKTIEGLSAHADQSEILAWLKVSSGSPRQVFVTHGEKVASVALAQQIEKDLLLKTCIPELGTTFDLT
jgi:metallo-beta-lactamase family protein